MKITTLLLLVVLFACKKECDRCDPDLFGRWEVTGLVSIESVLYEKMDGYNPVMEFKKGGSLDIKLDINLCFADFSITKGTTIDIGPAGCTEACCDSEFSQKLIEMLPQVKNWSVENDTLKLDVPGWGWIEAISLD